ncbi:MAG TPA: hypothetical protein VML75_01275 [Kofleriaceae bacterium]|nr:hypothetical protein [Kofleriaceae bacterium]
MIVGVLTAVGPAHADTATAAKDAAVRAIVGKTVPIRGSFKAIAVGYEPSKRVSIHADVGLAWGTTNSGVLGKTSVHHVTLVPRLSWAAASDRDFDGSVGLAIGHTWARGLAFGIEGGADLRLFGGVAIGPMAKARFGAGPVALYMMTWARFADETDIGFGIGLELFQLPALSTFDRARLSADAALGR